MKSFLLLLTFCHTCFAAPLQNHKINPTALHELMEALHISGDIIKETQKHWIRPPDKERWEINELTLDQRSCVLNWAQKQDLYAEWKPASNVYDVALILGATTPSMQLRLAYLKKLWVEGTRFHEVIWLTGDRPLDPRVDHLSDDCNTESEASHLLWQRADLPVEMSNLPVTFIASEMKTDRLALNRPNTKDTLLSWLQTQDSPRKTLFVSHQPFCGYQFAVINSVLPETFLFDLVGPGCNLDKHKHLAAVTLDTLARWLYQENKE